FHVTGVQTCALPICWIVVTHLGTITTSGEDGNGIRINRPNAIMGWHEISASGAIATSGVDADGVQVAGSAQRVRVQGTIQTSGEIGRASCRGREEQG